LAALRGTALGALVKSTYARKPKAAARGDPTPIPTPLDWLARN
jgi:hypothetical protein